MSVRAIVFVLALGAFLWCVVLSVGFGLAGSVASSARLGAASWLFLAVTLTAHAWPTEDES